MKKTILILSSLLILHLTTGYALADTINMINGTVIKGRIVKITSGIINVKTKEGFRKFSRIQVLNNRDFVELGHSKTQIIAGKIFLATRFTIELDTPEGLLKIPRWRIKNIVLGHVHQPEEELQIQLPEQVEKSPKDLQ